MPHSNRFLLPAALGLALLIAAAAGVFVWYAVVRPCESEAVAEASALLLSQLRRYDDVYQVATAATPASSVIPASVLQQILMDTDQVDVPACLQTAKAELVNYMGVVIQAFQAYGSQESDTVVRDLISESETHLVIFRTELKEIEACAPYCWR